MTNETLPIVIGDSAQDGESSIYLFERHDLRHPMVHR